MSSIYEAIKDEMSADMETRIFMHTDDTNLEISITIHDRHGRQLGYGYTSTIDLYPIVKECMKRRVLQGD